MIGFSRAGVLHWLRSILPTFDVRNGVRGLYVINCPTSAFEPSIAGYMHNEVLNANCGCHCGISKSNEAIHGIKLWYGFWLFTINCWYHVWHRPSAPRSVTGVRCSSSVPRSFSNLSVWSFNVLRSKTTESGLFLDNIIIHHLCTCNCGIWNCLILSKL